ncbi:MAG: protein-L-isoaspartate O-methyltransferase [Nanoarchaeota archaeon]|nr:protein-L-isoaspartate O-methyltransferase [Nanoarchaeota archaeon]
MEKTDLLKYLEKKGYPEKIVAAFAAIDREKFVPEHLKSYAYEDIALPLAEGSSISQPNTIAFMLELLELEKSQNILEVGTGSGFTLALTASIVTSGTIYGLEIDPHLSIKAKERLSGFSNIHLINKSGFYGYLEKAPFDRILISASCQEKPYYLLDQLTESGIIVAAVQDTVVQLKKIDGTVKEQVFYGFSFVPLVKRE